MSGSWLDPGPGPHATGDAMIALGDVQRGLESADTQLRAALALDWVSAAADGYRVELTDVQGEIGRLGVHLGSARSTVVQHLRAADSAHAAAEAAQLTAVERLPVWQGVGHAPAPVYGPPVPRPAHASAGVPAPTSGGDRRGPV
ncbi:hypothetical protein [Actinotalea subterranea]|uniref:hypothetical protein n=1 Tax=Actinotalea subterranea TaxID=2607497 RepID=UPI0011ED3D6C|nr:hypothetical protein [Actinotalea subterranea]